ncbi:MAG: hypothetical protein AAGJ74_09575 [Pseudomonadota bacterium]
MPKRTSPRDAEQVVDAEDLEELVQDKRASWRASGAKARRRQRRYKKLLLSRLPRTGAEVSDE